MNKSRRLVTETCSALADSGVATLVLDLFGTGDSEGGFSDATWPAWIANVVSAIRWIEEIGLSLHAVVGIRLGCAIAAGGIADADVAVPRTVFWQPVAAGRPFMTQFLRLRAMASMMDGGGEETVDELRQRIGHGETLEVAGYELSPALCAGIEAIELEPLVSDRLGRLSIIEVGRSAKPELSVAGQRFASAAADRGIDVEGRRVAGDPFWSATEIVTNPDVSALTVASIAGIEPS